MQCQLQQHAGVDGSAATVQTAFLTEGLRRGALTVSNVSAQGRMLTSAPFRRGAYLREKQGLVQTECFFILKSRDGWVSVYR
jgi:hypothetical protein